MSVVVASHCIVPAASQVPVSVRYYHPAGFVCVQHTLSVEDADAAIVLPQPRSIASLSRAGLLMVGVGLECRKWVEPYVKQDASSVGIYTALENGPDDFDHSVRMIGTDLEGFARTYRLGRSPKQHFRFLPNIPGSFVAIFLGVEGPLHVFTHSRHAVAHALAQAEFDLAYGTIRAAIVCSAFSLESPLISVRTSMDAPAGSTLCEGAACLILAADGQPSKWHAELGRRDGQRFFGVADPLVGLCERLRPTPAVPERGHVYA